MATFVVDPGHGGRDPGAVSRGLRECDIALVHADALATEIRRRGHTAHLTRMMDEDLAPDFPNFNGKTGNPTARSGKSVDLERRGVLSNRHRAAALISLHANAAARASANGAWVLYCKGSSHGEHLAHAVFAELEKIPGIPDADTAREVYPDASPATGYTLEAQRVLASRPADSLLSDAQWLTLQKLPEGRWYRRIEVLRGPKAPAVLVELGFLTHPEDAAQLCAPETPGIVAAAIADGLEAWLRTRAG